MRGTCPGFYPIVRGNDRVHNNPYVNGTVHVELRKLLTRPMVHDERLAVLVDDLGDRSLVDSVEKICYLAVHRRCVSV